MQRRVVIGVMGGGKASQSDWADAHQLGGLIAQQGWVLLTMSPQQASLEDVFVRLTTREDEMVPAAVGEVHDA